MVLKTKANEIIAINKLKKSYTTSSEVLKVLEEINLSVERGKIISIMGPSGSGKSTLLNIIGLLEPFEKGSYLIAGIDVSDLSSKEMQKIRLHKIGFVFQTFNLIQTLNVRQNVELPMALLKKPQEEQKQKSTLLLEQMGILNKANKFPYQLSIGEQQRVAIARALVNDPAIILCDEPTGNLDSDTTEIILAYLSKLIKKFDTTILLVSHNPAVKTITNKNYILKNGKLTLESDKIG